MAKLLGMYRRQVYRLLDRLRADGPEALVSWKRGRRSNQDFGDAFRVRVLDLMREHYHDFGPTLIRDPRKPFPYKNRAIAASGGPSRIQSGQPALKRAFPGTDHLGVSAP
ncbi:MAG: helix-turn-helix domain-containing protein [Sphingomonas sp.]|nr:helix-turn-helix domain-containing protein [Sphingomonas sp.]